MKSFLQPFYFGTSEKQLFGCYHAPQAAPVRDCGVVLCYPMGFEYTSSHRVYRQLAVRLSKVGFPVLRFDFYGSGDSAGECQQGTIRQWLADISTAIGEIKRRCGFVKVCLIGVRLGGTLSMMVGAERGDIEGVVLWDPVVSGRGYIEELRTLHKEMSPYFNGKPKGHIRAEKYTEILGFPVADSMLTGLEKIDLLAIRRKPANNILLIEGNEEAHEGRLREHLMSIDAHVEYQHLPSPKIWIQDAGKVLVPNRTLQSVVSWISKVSP